MPKGIYIRKLDFRKKVSDSRKGKGLGNKNSLGFKHSKETRLKLSVAKRKELNHNWKGGKSPKYMIKTAPRPKPDNCEVCGAMGVVMDHNHRTMKFRGWICNRCNVALGMVKDNSETLIALAEYLRTNGIFLKHNSYQEDILPQEEN